MHKHVGRYDEAYKTAALCQNISFISEYKIPGEEIKKKLRKG